MWVTTNCRLELDYQYPTPIILMLRPRSGAGQWVASESYDFTQTAEVIEYTDVYGNLCQKLTVPADGFVIETNARVNTAGQMDRGSGAGFNDVISLPEDALQFLLPSRYCESDRAGEQALQIVADAAPGYDQVERIVNWIRQHVTYAPGTKRHAAVSDGNCRSRPRRVQRSRAPWYCDVSQYQYSGKVCGWLFTRTGSDGSTCVV